MNKKVKMLVVSLCGAVALTSLGPVSASAATLSQAVELPQGNFVINEENTIILGQDEFSKKILNSVEIMTPYITQGSDNLYHLDPDAQKVVDQEVYNHFANGVQTLNSAISNQVSAGADQVISPMVYSNPYWWGVAVTFDDAETKRMVYSLQQTATVGALLAAVAAFIPYAQYGALVAAIEAAGATMIANSMSYRNNGRGVTLNLHWAPAVYYEVTSN
ncbi:hypothetical protein [Paenibacillus massiliensis]|uniref:hypothetical protein n=1 Tax=Paenibacillus massiliensis TaxID=225917 RepID=UPI000366DFF7|nr:hypothetical protein [Paenibacillus massiliensis]